MNLFNLPWWAFALLSAVFAAPTTIFAKLGVEQVSSNLATAIRTLVMLGIALSIVAFTGEIRALPTITRQSWWMLILSAVATGLSGLCYFRALQLGNASSVAPIDRASVALVLILSVVVLGEPLTWKAVMGTVAILIGLLFFLL